MTTGTGMSSDLRAPAADHGQWKEIRPSAELSLISWEKREWKRKLRLLMGQRRPNKIDGVRFYSP